MAISAITVGGMKAARQPQLLTIYTAIPPASAAQPSGPGLGHQPGADRRFAIQREPHQRIGRNEGPEVGGDRDQRHRQREHRDLHAGAIGGQIDHERLQHKRRDDGEDDAIHAVEAPAQSIGHSDVPMGRGDPRIIGGVAIFRGLSVPLFQRADDAAGIAIDIRHDAPDGDVPCVDCRPPALAPAAPPDCVF